MESAYGLRQVFGDLDIETELRRGGGRKGRLGRARDRAIFLEIKDWPIERS